jgi:hypothetical protein
MRYSITKWRGGWASSKCHLGAAAAASLVAFRASVQLYLFASPLCLCDPNISLHGSIESSDEFVVKLSHHLAHHCCIKRKARRSNLGARLRCHPANADPPPRGHSRPRLPLLTICCLCTLSRCGDYTLLHLEKIGRRTLASDHTATLWRIV